MLSALLLIGVAFLQPASPTPTQPESPPAKHEPDAKAKPKDEPTLKVGSTAPKLTATAWAKGPEVKAFDKGKTYAVVFLRSGDKPCTDALPRLVALTKKYPDLVIVGVASSEPKPKDPKDDKRLDTLKTYIKQQGDNLPFAVAYDANRANNADWIKPAGKKEIPTVFLIGPESTITFIGHPLDDAFDTAIGKHLKAAEEKKPSNSRKKSNKK